MYNMLNMVIVSFLRVSFLYLYIEQERSTSTDIIEQFF